MSENIKITKEMLAKAMECKTPEELIALAKENGIELSAERAKDYLKQLEGIDIQLSDEAMEKVAGGSGETWDTCFSDLF